MKRKRDAEKTKKIEFFQAVLDNEYKDYPKFGASNNRCSFFG